MKQHQDYDKIFKENIEKIGVSLLKKLCGIELTEVEKIETTLPCTLERRVDFACWGRNVKTNEKCICQTEFQSQNHQKMDGRLLLYNAIYYDKSHCEDSEISHYQDVC